MDALVFVTRGTVGRWDIYVRDPKGLLLGTIRKVTTGSFGSKPRPTRCLGSMRASTPTWMPP
jgi:hypothetical protein